MSTIAGIRDVAVDYVYSPAKVKSNNKISLNGRLAPLQRKVRHSVAAAKLKLVLGICVLCVAVFMTSRISSFMGWIPDDSHFDQEGYTVLIRTWRRNSPLKQSVAHYASCGGTDAIHVVWSATDGPSESLIAYLERIAFLKTQTALKPTFKVNINKDDNLNNRFKPNADLRTDAIFSVDDDVIVPCSTLDFAFSVWQSAPAAMVGFVPRLHWLDGRKNGLPYYKYGGWWSVWWTGTYSMVLSKAAFFHKKYMDVYNNMMPQQIQDYVARERSCEDIAMSLLVANATGAPPIWVKGKIHEIGSTGISSSFKGHNEERNKCLNDLITLYGAMPLVSTNVKAVNARQEWFW